MEDSEKVIVNFVNENNGKRHELEIPLNITAKALVTALNKAYNLQIDEANENECYMACEQPIAFLKGNRMLEDFGVRNGSTIIFGRKMKMENYGWSIELNPGYVLIIGNAPDAHIQLDSAYGRAVRVGLQVKDDISCAMLSEYSSSYNTLVNGKVFKGCNSKKS